jgi:hypothetical protein
MMNTIKTWPPYPLGAKYDGLGLILPSFYAHGVELCLYDDDGKEIGRVKLWNEHITAGMFMFPG